ncbi:MAG: hypothetical protein ABTQ29_10835 [Siculibacillus sp.]
MNGDLERGDERSVYDPTRRTLGEIPPGHAATPYSPLIDARVAEMRALLSRMRASSDAEALRALRSAFPDTSLAARVAAIAELHRGS